MKKFLLLSALAFAGLTASANDYFDVKVEGEVIADGETVTINPQLEDLVPGAGIYMVHGDLDLNIIPKKGAFRQVIVANCTEPGNENVKGEGYGAYSICYSCDEGGNCFMSTDENTLYTTNWVVKNDSFEWQIHAYQGTFTPTDPENYFKPMTVRLDMYACDGTDENAKIIEASKYTIYSQYVFDNSGVEVVADDAAAVYFDMQGRKVAQPEFGLYIVKRGNKVTKEFVR